MHKGKSLDYVLTFENLTPRDLNLKFQIDLVNTGTPPAKKDNDKLNALNLEANGSKFRVAGRVTSEQVPIDKSKELRVRVFGPTGEEILGKPFVIEFHQININKYMNINVFFGNTIHEGTDQHCFQVSYRRREDDPVKEPILPEELECRIQDLVGRPKEGELRWPGQDYTWHVPTRGVTQGFKWSGRIENEEVTGEDTKPWSKK